MTEVTITEYETTERTVDKIECDHCGVVVDEEEATTVWMKRTDKEHEPSIEVRDKHYCEDCVGLREAIAVRETKDYYRAFWEGTKGKVGWILLLIPTFIFGVAQGLLFANTEAATLVERVGASFIVMFVMLCLGLVYAILTANSSG